MVNNSLLFLVGFSGSGKSTIGPLLAEKLKIKFVDLDELTARKERMTVSDIFRKKGEKAFRQAEIKALRDLILNRKSQMVVALGGGTFQNPKTRKITNENGLSIYLSCSRREIYNRLKDNTNRPLLKVKPQKNETEKQALLKRINSLLNQRIKNYNKAAIRVSTSEKNINKIINEIIRKIPKYQ